MGAGAVVVDPEIGQNSISTQQTAWTDAVAAGDTITISSSLVNGILANDGFAINDNMYVGMATDQGSQTGNLYVLNTVQDPFTVISSGDISIGAILQVLDGKNLGFKASDTNPVTFDLTIGSGSVNEGVKIGDAANTASLSVAGVGTLTVNGSVVAYGDFSVNADNAKLGAVNIYSGNTDVVTGNDINLSGLVANGGGNTTLVAGGGIVSDATVQNLAGDMVLRAQKDIDISGALENKSDGDITISAQDLVVGGAMTNENSGTSMTLNLDNWTINGGGQATYSFINAGNLYAVVSGDTYMEYGMNLGNMSMNDVFSLDTGTLTFGNNATNQTWFNAFSNYLNNFNLAIRDGNLAVETIVNGINSDNVVNTNANMSILAQNVDATTVRNSGGTLTIKAADLASGYDITQPSGAATIGNINIDGQIIGGAQSATNIVASGTVAATGAVSNSGEMTLNGNVVQLGALANTGTAAKLVVSSLTEASGVVQVSGDVTNTAGQTTIWARDVTVGGNINNVSGSTSVLGSDSGGGAVKIGGLAVNGGDVSLNALAGAVSVDNTVTVSGGTLNLGGSLRNFTVGGNVQIAGDVTASATDATGAGDVNISATGTTPFVMSADAVLVGGDLSVVDNSVVRNIQVDSALINIGGNATVANMGMLTLGTDATAYVRVSDGLSVTDGGTFETFANDLLVGELIGNGKFLMHGVNVTANQGNIDLDGNLYFDVAADPLSPTAGMIVRGTDALVLKTTNTGADINVGAISVGTEKSLTFNSADAVEITGTVSGNGAFDVVAVGDVTVGGTITNSGTVSLSGQNINTQGVINSGSADFVAEVISAGNLNNTGVLKITAQTGAVNAGNIITSDALVIDAATQILAGTVTHTGGSMSLVANTAQLQGLQIGDAVGTVAEINIDDFIVLGNTAVSGDFIQGAGTSGMLNFVGDTFKTSGLNIGGDVVVMSGQTMYDVGANLVVSGDVNVSAGGALYNVVNDARITGDVTVQADTAVAILSGGAVRAGNLTNAGGADFVAKNGIQFANVTNNAGTLTIDSGRGAIDADDFVVNSGNVVIDGTQANLSGAMNAGILYQGFGGTLASRDVSLLADKYEISAAAINLSGINQQGQLVINSSDVFVDGDIVANDLRFIAQLGDGWNDENPQLAWQSVDITGNVSGGVDFIGLGKMQIGGNYVFDANSVINAAILPYATGAGSSDINYWATVSLAQDNTLGDITNAADGRALIEIADKFIGGTQYDAGSLLPDNSAVALGNGQIGIDLFNVIDQGTAIWLVHAEKGVENFGQLEQLRNLDVKFCNADGSLCYNYLESLRVKNDVDLNATDEDLPAYISVRDSDGDGVADSLYVVFDPRFGGPVLLENLKIQPIVGREPDHTNGEFVAAGALDDLLIGQAHDRLFLNGAPLEIVPIIFAGTNMEEMANELYNRMEYYVENSDGKGLARFSRLFQVRELEQIAGAVALNEHTTSRSFEDRMFDEFIWNRNRQLKKAWLDMDYGMFYQNIDDGKHTDGNRFSIAGGFDWQETNTLVLGLAGRVSHTSSKAGDTMDLGYLPGQSIAGNVKLDVADTNIGFGGYLMKTLGEKVRLYGNGFIDFHFFDVKRDQNFVAPIDGDGSAFSVVSEWGVMHDILNQYIVGNLYARLGYNFGFDIKEKVLGDDYMQLSSDGYFMLTPGYSLVAQKRIYPSAWFQIRPYASIGVEYDVLGMPDFAEYKFAPSEQFTRYDININPLWANIGGGVEILSARGIQFGLDYRYQYNADIQLHNIKVSGSYRF